MSKIKKYWIDKDLDLYIKIDKDEIVKNFMISIFSSSGISEDKINIDNSIPGLPTLLDILINILVKIIGNFSKEFYHLKNTIDLISGLEFEKIFKDAIPNLIVALKDTKTLISNPVKWITLNIIESLIESNIPIPAFTFEIKEYVPFLSGTIEIPEIDPYKYFTKDTPFNLDIKNPSLEWLNNIQKEIKELKEKDKEKSLKKNKEKLKEISDKIEKIEKNLKQENAYLTQLNNCNLLLEKLNRKEKICHINGCDIKTIDLICQDIKKCQNKLINLTSKFNIEENRLNNLNIEKEKNKLKELKLIEKNLKKNLSITTVDYNKRALYLSYKNNINIDNFDVKLSNIHNSGIDVFDNEILELLQKIGYNFSNDKNINKLKNLILENINLNDKKLLEALFQIGFNLNDDKYLDKIIKFKKYVKIDYIILNMLIESGFNFNNPNIFNILSFLKNNNIDINNKNLLNRLYNIGFNFNNPNIIEKLKSLIKYVNLKDEESYNTIIKRNISLNNPYLEDVLKQTYMIGLRWGKNTGGKSYFDMEEEILTNTEIPKNVNLIFDILKEFEVKGYKEKYYYNQKYLYAPYIKTNFKHKYKDMISENDYFYTEKIFPAWVDMRGFLHDKGFVFLDALNKLDTIYVIKTFNDYHGAKINLYVDSNLVKTYQPISGQNIEESITIPWGRKLELEWVSGSDDSVASYSLERDNTIVDSFISGSAPSAGVFFSEQLKTTKIVENYKLQSVTLSHFYKQINQYEKYGIKLDIPKLDDIKPYNNEYNINDEKAKKFIKNSEEYIEKLKLLKEFHINKGWKFDNNIANEIFGGKNITDNWNNINEDFDNLIDGLKLGNNKLKLVKQPSQNPSEITFSELNSVYSNFEKLGLNIRDKNFNHKFDLLFNKFNLKIDETVLLDTSKTITLTYTDMDTLKWNNGIPYHPKVSIDLSNGIVDPKIYSDEKYNAKIKITEKLKQNAQPAKALVQFETLQQLGFNYNYDDYYLFIQKLSSSLNMKKYEIKLISERLISLGWHWSNDKNFYKYNLLEQLGFSFNIIEEINDNYVSQIYSKLEHFNNWGFSFFRKDYLKILNKMKSLKIYFNNNDFESIIEKLIGLGISLYDNDWEYKLQTLLDLKIYFNKDDWKYKLENLHLLGIDFSKNDWKEELRKIKEFKDVGLNYMNFNLLEKIAILRDLGVDFSKDDWKEKLDSLIELKLIYLSQNANKQKNDFLKKQKEKAKQIQNDIIKYEKLNHSPSYLIDEKIEKLLIQINIKENKCENSDNLKNELNQLQLQKKNLIKSNINYDDKINKLKNELYILKNTKNYNLNTELKFESLDKFKALKTSGINFFDKNYQKNIFDIIKQDFDFSKNDWKEKLKEINININSKIEWKKTISEVFKSIIMLPLQILTYPDVKRGGVLRLMIDIMSSIIHIPLNPIKITKWSINILKSFQNFIKIIKKLSKIDIMNDFLFLDKNGQLLIDKKVPGFSEFIKTLKESAKQWNKELINKNKQFSNKLIEIKKLKEEQIILNNQKMILDDNVQEKNNLINNEKKLKEMLKLNLTNSELKKIQKDLEINCELLKTLENNININIDVDSINNNLKKIDNKIQQKNKELIKLKENINKLKMKTDYLKDISTWNQDFSKLIKYTLNDFRLKIENEKNPYDQQLKNIEIELKNNKNNLIKTQTQLNSISSLTNEQNEHIIEIEINRLKKYVCNNSLSKYDIDIATEKLNDLLKKQIEIKKMSSLPKIINNNLLDIKNKISELEKNKSKLEKKSNDFIKNQKLKSSELDNVINWLPTNLNIINNLPKLLVNMIREIFNSVNHMKHLPDLWYFKQLD